MEKLIRKIEELRVVLSHMLPMKQEFKTALDKKFRLEFNFNSNHLEGNTLTYNETKLLLFFDETKGNHALREYEEMKAHDTALQLIKDWVGDSERPLTEISIKNLNEVILVKPFWKDAVTPNGQKTRRLIKVGDYKEYPNSVRLSNGEVFEYASVNDTPIQMGELIQWYRNEVEKKELHTVELAALLHYKFVCIHPFDDGNGRISRLLMNYILFENNLPLVVIKSADKRNYLSALNSADSGDLTSFIKYISQQLIWSLELSIKAAKGEDIEELGDIEKQIEILKREKLTKTKIFKTPKVTYELIKHIDNDLWNPLSNALEKFKDFFAETTSEIYMDYSRHRETRTIKSPISKISSMYADKEVEIKPYEIFGKDLEEEKINNVTWTKRMLSLKSASRKLDYEISCILSLNESNYELKIVESNATGDGVVKDKTVLVDVENEYKFFFMADTIDNMLKEISKHLITIIQTVE